MFAPPAHFFNWTISMLPSSNRRPVGARPFCADRSHPYPLATTRQSLFESPMSLNIGRSAGTSPKPTLAQKQLV